MFPEGLYQLRNSDVETQYLNVILRSIYNQDTATSVTAQIIIPEGQVWLIQNVFCFANGGGGQVCNALRSTINTIGGSFITTLFDDREIGGLGVVGRDRQYGGLILKGPCVIKSIGTFNSGVSTNTVTLDIAGIGIPRGNWNQI